MARRALDEILTLFVSILGLCKWSWNHLGLGVWYCICSIALITRLLSRGGGANIRTATWLHYRYQWFIVQLEGWSSWALGTLAPLCLALQFSSTWWVRLLLVWLGLSLLGTRLNDESSEELFISKEHFFALSHWACMMMLIVSTPDNGHISSSLGTAFLAWGTLLLARPDAELGPWRCEELAPIALAMANTSFLAT